VIATGGSGTLEELFEAITLKRLRLNRPQRRLEQGARPAC
jgi:predicted Rossmann-fold nucleotide-binding protein